MSSQRSILSLVLVICAASACVGLPIRIPRFRPPLALQRVLGEQASSASIENAQNQPLHLRKDLLSQCQLRWRNATLDHFTWKAGDGGVTAFKQRYFVCGREWAPDSRGRPGPIFFYLGNEADVTLYLNNTGLMWESAPLFRAMLVFAEHRYYGQSLPYPKKDLRKHMHYLSAEQATADYAELIAELRAEFAQTSDSPSARSKRIPVIGFGGSYGGMLAAWMRAKYPAALDGAIAGSAPIWAFTGLDPPVDPLSFSKGVTYDASRSGGSAPACADNVRAGWAALDALGKSDKGRANITRAMQLCPSAKLATNDDVIALRDWLAAAWDYMAMGNFPYPSPYILNGAGLLPAFPVRVACQALADRRLADDTDQLLAGMAAAAGVFYNFSGTLTCLDFHRGASPESDEDSNFWDYQYCTEMFMPFGKDGVADMFWSEPWNASAAAAACQSQWGVTPRQHWAVVEWGGRDIAASTRIAFTNGLLDPWHGTGVLRDAGRDLPAIIIPEGAHHLDLMFSNPDDPPSVIAVREAERRLISRWLREASREHGQHDQEEEGDDSDGEEEDAEEGGLAALWRKWGWKSWSGMAQLKSRGGRAGMSM